MGHNMTVKTLLETDASAYFGTALTYLFYVATRFQIYLTGTFSYQHIFLHPFASDNEV